MKRIKLFEPSIDNREILAVKKVLKSGWLSYGKASLELEERVKKKFKLSNVIAANSCTNGLHASLIACDVGKNDEVITSPFTFVSTINNLHHIQSKIILADIDNIYIQFFNSLPVINYNYIFSCTIAKNKYKNHLVLFWKFVMIDLWQFYISEK